MITVNTVAALREAVSAARRAGKRIAFVPTMGNLHAGHGALVVRATTLADFVVASVFVNPLQFGANEDLDSYPRTLAADQQRLTEAGCDLLFAPTVSEMYPDGMPGLTNVSVPGVSSGLCGGSRPGHFDGVATVVTKLFNMVQPDVAIFGEKDFQQLAVIRKMVRDLNMPVEIVGQPIVRAEDGLALSSRNGYLSAEQRAVAPGLYQILQQLADALRDGEKNHAALAGEGCRLLELAGFVPDYLEIRDPLTLLPADSAARQLIIVAAARLGTTRLIDNLLVDLDATA